jgi:hypothetical protein
MKQANSNQVTYDSAKPNKITLSKCVIRASLADPLKGPNLYFAGEVTVWANFFDPSRYPSARKIFCGLP